MSDFYDIDQVQENLPKAYRLHTRFADLEGRAEFVFSKPDITFVQYKQKTKVKLFGFIPWTKRTWINIGKVAPSMVGLTQFPVVAIYKRFMRHLSVIEAALKETEFKVLLEGSRESSV